MIENKKIFVYKDWDAQKCFQITYLEPEMPGSFFIVFFFSAYQSDRFSLLENVLSCSYYNY